MSTKVKRGLGLLVVAVLALLAQAVAHGASSSASGVAAVLLWLAFLGCLLAGLVLVAWGLLRD